MLDLQADAATKFEIHQKIGSGSYGRVYKAWDLRGQRFVAAKVLEEDRWIPVSSLEEEPEETTISDMALREISFLRFITLCNVPFTTHLLDFSFEMGEHVALVLALPLLEGDLSDAIEKGAPMPAQQRLSIGLDVLCAVTHLHRLKPAVLHRDIKPENVLLTKEGRGMLSDFGFACFETAAAFPEEEYDKKATKATNRRRRAEGSANKSHSGILGTSTYNAPEVLLRSDQRPSRDVWALGVLLLELLEWRRLDADTDREAFGEIRRRLSALRERSSVDRDLLCILSAFLNRNPSKRGTAEGAVQTLSALGYITSAPPKNVHQKTAKGTRSACRDFLLRRLSVSTDCKKEEVTLDEASTAPSSCRDSSEEDSWKEGEEELARSLQMQTRESVVAARLFERLFPDLDRKALYAVAAKVYEHRCLEDAEMTEVLGIDIDLLEDVQEKLLVRTGGCLLIPHLRNVARALPGD